VGCRQASGSRRQDIAAVMSPCRKRLRLTPVA